MKKADVKLGKTYTAKVSNRIVPVRIDAVHSVGGWVATNLKTNKKVRIKSAQLLRGVYHATTAKISVGAANNAKSNKQADTGERGTKQGRPSLLDVAAQLLGEANDPLSCQAMITMMLERKLWKTSGKTPANTLSAAIRREIKATGSASRFRKVERGLFTVR